MGTEKVDAVWLLAVKHVVAEKLCDLVADAHNIDGPNGLLEVSARLMALDIYIAKAAGFEKAAMVKQYADGWDEME